jgi:hypothetical protein
MQRGFSRTEDPGRVWWSHNTRNSAPWTKNIVKRGNDDHAYTRASIDRVVFRDVIQGIAHEYVRGE